MSYSFPRSVLEALAAEYRSCRYEDDSMSAARAIASALRTEDIPAALRVYYRPCPDAYTHDALRVRGVSHPIARFVVCVANGSILDPRFDLPIESQGYEGITFKNPEGVRHDELPELREQA